MGQQLEQAPELAEAFSQGKLSVAEAKVVSRAAAIDPEAAPSLLETAQRGDFVGLKRAAEALELAAIGEAGQVAMERRAHTMRFCRWSKAPTGGMRLEALLTTADGAALVAAIEGVAKNLCGKDRSFDQARVDALVGLVTGGRGASHAPRAQMVVRVDAAALQRGFVEGTECCEIAGVGSVPVATARSLLSESMLALLVKEGQDITTVTSWSRVIPRKVETAVLDRDRCCVVPGCHATRFLQVDHWQTDFGQHGPTELANLCALCSAHHAMKSHGDYELLGGPGNWIWLPTKQFWRRQRRDKERLETARERGRAERPAPMGRTG